MATPTTTFLPTLVVFRVAQIAACCLCGAPLSDTEDCPLCPACEREEDAKWHDYLADCATKRWPI